MCPQGESGGTPLSHELGGGFEFKFLERVKQRSLFRVTAAYRGLGEREKAAQMTAVLGRLLARQSAKPAAVKTATPH